MYMLDAIYNDRGRCGFVVKQQPLYGNGRIIDRFCGHFSQTVALQTAVTVDPIANAVEEIAACAIYRNGRQIIQIRSDVDGLHARLLADICPEIIPGSGWRIPEFLRQFQICRVIQKAVQRPISAGQKNTFALRNGCKKRGIVTDLREVRELPQLPR